MLVSTLQQHFTLCRRYRSRYFLSTSGIFSDMPCIKEQKRQLAINRMTKIKYHVSHNDICHECLLIQPDSPTRGLTVTATSMYGMLWPTCNHSHKVVASASAEIFLTSDLDVGSGQGHTNIHNTCRTTSIPNHVTVASRSTEICGHLNVVKYRHSMKYEL